MITFQQLQEGVYDPNIFKAFFLAGGPGSGKSYAVQKGFGQKSQKITVTAQGLKVVNSDSVFETYLKQARLNFQMPPSQGAERDAQRTRAKRATKLRQDNYVEGRLGLVIDGTGKDYGKISTEASNLKQIGYDVHMVYINTSLEVALERNKKRDRVVPEKIVITSWKQVQANIGKFNSFFGSKNFLVIDNNDPDEVIWPEIQKAINRMINKKVNNFIAKAWIAQQLALKRSGFDRK